MACGFALALSYLSARACPRLFGQAGASASAARAPRLVCVNRDLDQHAVRLHRAARTAPPPPMYKHAISGRSAHCRPAARRHVTHIRHTSPRSRACSASLCSCRAPYWSLLVFPSAARVHSSPIGRSACSRQPPPPRATGNPLRLLRSDRGADGPTPPTKGRSHGYLCKGRERVPPSRQHHPTRPPPRHHCPMRPPPLMPRRSSERSQKETEPSSASFVTRAAAAAAAAAAARAGRRVRAQAAAAPTITHSCC